MVEILKSASSYKIVGLEPNKYYYVEIAGYNVAGVGPYGEGLCNVDSTGR